MAPRDPPRGVSSDANPPNPPKKGHVRKPRVTKTSASVDLGSGSAVTNDTKDPKWLTAPASKSGPTTVPSCSEVAVNAGWSMAVLHELGAYCVGLPVEGDGWEDKRGRWVNRERLDDRFVEFRLATAARKWNQAFQNPASCGVTAPLLALHTVLCEKAAESFQRGAALDSKVHQYLLPRTAVVLQAVDRAQRFLRMKGVDGFALSEDDHRHSLDQFLDDLLNDEPDNRSTLNERTLNFPRNEIYDEVVTNQTRTPLPPTSSVPTSSVPTSSAPKASAPKTSAPKTSAPKTSASKTSAPKKFAGTPSEIRAKEHVFFTEYLTQGSVFYADATDVPVADPTATSTTTRYQRGQAALDAVDQAFASQQSRFELVFFRELLSLRRADEQANLKVWGKVPMTREGRMRVSPRTGRCDAVNFLHLKVELPVPALPNVETVIKRLRECSLVQLTDADVKEIQDSHRTEEEEEDAKTLTGYRECPQLGRRVNLANVNDVIGHASVYADIRNQQAPTQQTTQQDRTAQPQAGVPLLIPVLLYEYKKNFEKHQCKGLFQLRLYLNATCRFLEKLGVVGFMTFGILTEGTKAIVIGAWRDAGGDNDDEPPMTWIVDQYTASYDITKPQDAFQLACFVVWVKVVHMPKLAKHLTEETLVNFRSNVLAGMMNWTMNHQIPPT